MPSNPVLESVQPLMLIRIASVPGKQKSSSASVGEALLPNPSVLPAGQVMGLPLASSPKGVAGMGFGPLQFSKCPISSVKEMLVVCAAQMVRVCSDEVEYIGWKSYGISLQLVPVGANWTWPNPLAALAVMDPVWPLVRSS